MNLQIHYIFVNPWILDTFYISIGGHWTLATYTRGFGFKPRYKHMAWSYLS